MDFSLIVTLGPAILNKDKLLEISRLGNCWFRINGAHAKAEQATQIITDVRNVLPDAKILMDLPGNKIRTSNLSIPMQLVKGQTLVLYPYQLNFPEFYKLLSPGQFIYANDSVYTLEVKEINGDEVTLLSYSDGTLGSNKGLHVRGIHEKIPFLFQADKDLIEVAADQQIDFISLSFVRNAKDVLEAKELLAPKKFKPQLIAKIETKASLDNLLEIFNEVGIVNVDRGDLSTDIGLLKIPVAEQRIVEAAKRANKKVFLATQFLKNMELNPVPLIAELSALHQTMLAGVSGIQLSEETAMGRYPAECVKLVFDVLKGSFQVG